MYLLLSSKHFPVNKFIVTQPVSYSTWNTLMDITRGDTILPHR